MSEGNQMHTALPWKIGAYGDICYGAGDWSGIPLHTGWVEEAYRFHPEAEANAAYIVTACNAFPALVEALKPFLPAYNAYVETMQNFCISGETSAERRFSEGERRDEARDRAFEELAKVTFDQLAAVAAALAAASTEGGQ